VRRNNRGLPVDTVELNKYIESQGGPANYLKTPFPPYLDNTVLHPMQPNWIINGAVLGSEGALRPDAPGRRADRATGSVPSPLVFGGG